MRHMTRPFWRYYGGKFRASPKYRPPKHKTIIEPFAGAAGYSCLYPDHDVILVDASEKVCAVWEYLIGASPEEILDLPDLVHGVSVDELSLPQDVRWFLGFWCNAGSASPCKSPSAWASLATNRHKGWNHPATRHAIARQVTMIKHWKIMHGTYRDSPEIEACWFIDPPYAGAAGSHYPKGSKSIDYSDLSDWCMSRAGQVTVCEADGADWLPFQHFANIKATSSKARKGKSAEAIWTNDDWKPLHQFKLL